MGGLVSCADSESCHREEICCGVCELAGAMPQSSQYWWLSVIPVTRHKTGYFDHSYKNSIIDILFDQLNSLFKSIVAPKWLNLKL